MITEDYCSYEVSKLLKEKGFDGECVGCYWDPKKTFDINYEPSRYSDGDLRDEVVLAPTHQMAMKWLREEHKLSIEISSTESDKWVACVYEIGVTRNFVEAYISTYDTYKEAIDAALKYCLTNLI